MERLHYMNLNDTHRNELIRLARASVVEGFADRPWPAKPPGSETCATALQALRGSFVTLRRQKQLRGCCGTVTATRSLYDDVWQNAWAAAFADPRFSPLAADEWPEINVHLSVLSPLEIMHVANEQELIAQLRPNIDGLLLERDDSRATFLPDVWEQVPDPVDFVRHLKQKAGWPAAGWSWQIKVWRYTTESFGEPTHENGIGSKKASRWA